MSDKTTRAIIEEIIASVDIPESAYKKAEARYKDLGEWFGRPEAKCAEFDPHIYPQGSFRLGTVVRSDEYDLDFGCRLRQGISKSTHSQKQLKALVGADMEEYRKARRIESALKEKPRCWRLSATRIWRKKLPKPRSLFWRARRRRSDPRPSYPVGFAARRITSAPRH